MFFVEKNCVENFSNYIITFDCYENMNKMYGHSINLFGFLFELSFVGATVDFTPQKSDFEMFYIDLYRKK